MLLPDKAYV